MAHNGADLLRRRCARLAAAVLVILASSRHPSVAQQPDLAAVLAQAAERAAELSAPNRLLVCEEHYKQLLDRVRAIVGFDVGGPVGSRSEVAPVGVDKREWIAELALFPTPGNAAEGLPWREFRDIVSIDGVPHDDGAAQLSRLASVPADVAGVTALDISLGASAHMFGRLLRALDIPRAAQIFLHPSNQPRFEFKKGGQKTIAGVKTMEVKFRETSRPTIIRASGNGDAPSSGSFWIDPATGDVLMSVLKSADSREISDELTVTYERVPELGLCLPATLTERIVDDPAGQRVQTSATFTKWRAVPRKQG